MTCPRPHSKILWIPVVSPEPSCFPKRANFENNEWLDFTHSLRKESVLAEVIYDYETEKKFLLGCIGKNQEWAHKLLACPHDDTKDPIPLPVWAVTVSANGNYTCLEQKKRDLWRKHLLPINTGFYSPVISSPLPRQQKTTHFVHLAPWGCNFYDVFSHFSPQPHPTLTH